MEYTKHIECIISGRVQMVMYRDFVARSAKRLGVVGTVHNELDGTVCVVAEGTEDILQKLIIQLKKGSIFSHVEDVHVVWRESTGTFQDFAINY